MRCFIAVRIPPLPPLLTALDTLGRMGRAIRPVAPENLHITLRFLGEIVGEQQEPIIAALCKAVGEMVAFDLNLSGAGVLPDARRPTVFWIGGSEPGAGTLATLVEDLSSGLEPLGFARDPRPWRCHLTLARIKAHPPAQWEDFLTAQRTGDFGSVRVGAVDLMASHLLPAGPQYTVVASVPLAKSI